MQNLDKNSVGLALGSFVALWHFVWAVLLALGITKPLLDIVLSLHNLSVNVSVTDFSFGKAFGLIIVTFIVGYIFGWLFAAVWNATKK